VLIVVTGGSFINLSETRQTLKVFRSKFKPYDQTKLLGIALYLARGLEVGLHDPAISCIETNLIHENKFGSNSHQCKFDAIRGNFVMAL
jgi:hypothetical protein